MMTSGEKCRKSLTNCIRKKVKVAQSCPTLCDTMDHILGSLFLLQGIFPAQGSNPGLPHCRQILYQLSHKGEHPNAHPSDYCYFSFFTSPIYLEEFTYEQAEFGLRDLQVARRTVKEQVIHIASSFPPPFILNSLEFGFGYALPEGAFHQGRRTTEDFKTELTIFLQ